MVRPICIPCPLVLQQNVVATINVIFGSERLACTYAVNFWDPLTPHPFCRHVPQNVQWCQLGAGRSVQTQEQQNIESLKFVSLPPIIPYQLGYPVPQPLIVLLYCFMLLFRGGDGLNNILVRAECVHQRSALRWPLFLVLNLFLLISC